MKEGSIKSPKLIYEEKKAIKLFLWMFYIIYFSFDFYFYFIFPSFTHDKPFGIPQEGLGIWLYILIAGLFLIAIYFFKKGNPYFIKYIYITSYIGIDLVNNLLTYLGTTKSFSSGNIVEVLFLLFSPIFVNKRYFWTVTIGLIGKDLLLMLILRDTYVLFPVLILFFISIIAYIILIRFYSYINSLTYVHEELRQNERLAVIGQMAAAIGHEIRNPLSSLKGFIQLQEEQFPKLNDYYPIMIQEVDRINSIVNDLMYIGKPRVIDLEKVDIEEMIDYTLSITKQLAEKQEVFIDKVITGTLPLFESDSKQLKQVFLNLIKNAIESMPNGGKIVVSVKVLEGTKLFISIQDTGCGIAKENIPNLGQPFFTTKKDGTGLGLMVTSQIIKDHNGDLEIESKIGNGTKVNVILPIGRKKME